jgi:uncharacterized membrane protein YhaH (DUF805 family)
MENRKYYWAMSLWVIIAIVWFIQSYRFFDKGDWVGGILYIITGVAWIFFGSIITKKSLRDKKNGK